MNTDSDLDLLNGFVTLCAPDTEPHVAYVLTEADRGVLDAFVRQSHENLRQRAARKSGGPEATACGEPPVTDRSLIEAAVKLMAVSAAAATYTVQALLSAAPSKNSSPP